MKVKIIVINPAKEVVENSVNTSATCGKDNLKGSDFDLDSILKEVLQENLGEEYYIYKLAEKKGWEPKKMLSYIDNLTKFSPQAAFSVLLREIAIDFDNKYKDHIEKSKEIWVVSLLDGKVEQINKAKVKNYRNFSAFRCREDAEKACKILDKRLKNMFCFYNE